MQQIYLLRARRGAARISFYSHITYFLLQLLRLAVIYTTAIHLFISYAFDNELLF